MGNWNRLIVGHLRAAHLRRLTHGLVLAAIGLIVGVTSLTASAAESEQTQEPAPVVASVPRSPADVQLKVGKSATVDDGALKITLLAVTEDSRCPKDVLCVWSGRAVVVLHVELDGVDQGDAKATLMPGRQGPSDLDAAVGRYILGLTDLQPYPDRSHPEPTLEPVATIRVTVNP